MLVHWKCQNNLLTATTVPLLHNVYQSMGCKPLPPSILGRWLHDHTGQTSPAAGDCCIRVIFYDEHWPLCYTMTELGMLHIVSSLCF